MSTGALLLVIAAMAVLAYWLGKTRSLALVGGARGLRQLHSLPSYYGLLTALWCALPCLLVLVIWVVLQDRILTALVAAGLGSAAPADPAAFGLLMNDVHNVLTGAVPLESIAPDAQAAVGHYQRLRTISAVALTGVVLALGVIAIVVARARIVPALRARNAVETIGTGLLLACASLAVFVTLGIVLSVVYEAVLFFQSVPVHEFLFGLEWSPQTALRADQVGSSGSFGAVPLFLGTMMISGIAMLIAVPIGLFSAIYLAEYANRRFRAWAKPLLEILAGIPTVVYGFFAALTLGPALRAFGESIGLEVASESALAAGLVMGVMIIPFVSSLSDDMIGALLTGDQEFDSPKTLAAFALGLMLFVVTLVLNFIALYVVRKYREQYE
jgi:phosphate transport system permease protein